MPLYNPPTAGASALNIAFVNKVSANVVVTESSWTLVSAGFDISVTAVTGDLLLFWFSCLTSNENNQITLDVFLTSSSRFISSGTTTACTGGVPSWRGVTTQYYNLGGVWLYTVQATDVNAGAVACRLYGMTDNAADRTIRANADEPAQLGVVNLG